MMVFVDIRGVLIFKNVCVVKNLWICCSSLVCSWSVLREVFGWKDFM